MPARNRTATIKRFVPTPVAAEMLEVSKRTLEKWRWENGAGPPFRKFGRKVVYDVNDLHEWAEAQRRISTSDPGLSTANATLLARLRGEGREE